MTDKITNTLLTNRENIRDMNIPMDWFIEKKPLGISGVARLKNGGEFLEKVIESHINFLDEIILVNNMSSDNTKNICMKLIEKYPKKIKYFDYDYEVYGAGRTEIIPGNSIHSLAYYYNWAFSKTSYQYVVKIDDDNFLLKDKWRQIRAYIINTKPKKFINFFGFNLIKTPDGKIGIPSLDKRSGGYGDIGVYPVSNKTYYIQGKSFELLKNNLYFKDLGLSYLHLKYLKKDFGLGNYRNTSIETEILHKLKTSKILNIQSYTAVDANLINFLKNKKYE